jgi:hypothetical protein
VAYITNGILQNPSAYTHTSQAACRINRIQSGVGGILPGRG